MLFLLFLFLGAVGAQAGGLAKCNISEEKLTCNIEKCLNSGDYSKTTNVTCTCLGDGDDGDYCALELVSDSNGGKCVLTLQEDTEEKPISCKGNEGEICKTNCTKTKKEDLNHQFECDCEKTEGAQNQGKKGEGAQNQGKKAEGAQNQGKKAEGTQNQVKKAEGAQNQGKKAEGAQNQGKKGEGAQNQEKKADDLQNQENKDNKEPLPQDSAGAQNSDRSEEAQSTESGTGASSASEGNAKQSAQHEKKEEGVSAAARNSQKAAYLYPLFSFIAVMPRIN